MGKGDISLKQASTRLAITQKAFSHLVHYILNSPILVSLFIQTQILDL